MLHKTANKGEGEGAWLPATSARVRGCATMYEPHLHHPSDPYHSIQVNDTVVLFCLSA